MRSSFPIDNPKIIERIMQILADSNGNDPYIIARQIFREVVAVEVEQTIHEWQAFGTAHGFNRGGH